MIKGNRVIIKEEVIIKGESYYLIKNFKDNKQYRQSLNGLIMKVFGFDFEDWYRQGFWTDKYIPYSLLYKDNVVANVSISIMDLIIEEKPTKAIQIGTVVTDPDYRNRGLSRTLIERVLKDVSKSYEFIYLYANDTVTDFYPRFGFIKTAEYIHSSVISKGSVNYSFSKLNINDMKDRKLLIELIKDSIPLSRYSMINNMELIMFYLGYFMSEDIYYCRDQDLAAVVQYKEQEMFLIDVFCRKDFCLHELVSSLLISDSMKVVLGFTPKDSTGYQKDKTYDDNLFVMKGSLNIDGRFPILSRT